MAGKCTGSDRQWYGNHSDGNLYELSNGMLQYEGYKISDIDANDTGCVRFTNGEELHGGEVANNSQEMSDLRRVQIRETIKSSIRTQVQKLTKQ